jgi:anti-sigma factor RsiW
MSCDHLLNTQSYIDGALAGMEAVEAERHLQTCAECQAFAAGAAELSDALRNSPRHAAPAHLRAAVLARLDREPVNLPRRSFWIGAASGAAVSALAAAMAVLAILPPSAASLTQAVADAHANALLKNQVIMVASSNHHTVKPWLAAHAAISPPVQDFAADGFSLAGGRVDEVAGTRTAVMVYRHGNHQIDVFAWPDRGATLPQPGMTRGFRSAFWKQGDLDFAAVSDMDAQAFEKFVGLARAVRE